MALSADTKKVIHNSLTIDKAADELVSAVDAAFSTKASTIAAITSVNIPVTTVAATGTPDCDAAAINAALATVIGNVEARLDAVEAKVNAVIASLKAAGLMS